MKKSIVAVIVVAVIAFACSSTKETKSGYKFNVVKAGDGKQAESGQILVMNMLFKDAKDSVWADSRKQDFPTMVQKQDSVPGKDPVLEIFQMLTKGDSVTFQIVAKELFETTFKSPIPPGVDPAGMFTFEIGVTDIISEDDAKKLQNEIMAKLNEKEVAKQNEQLAADTVIIDNYLKEKSLVAQKTASGLRYIIEKQGTGANAQSGQTVRINYSGFLLDGTCFDSSSESIARANNVFNEMRKPYEPLELVLGYRQVIQGWEEAIALMNKGTKMTVFVPSPLAYGAQKRSEVIVENSILRFEMELIDIK
jgi:FKBP-type peptidyl-prolyl cis-trans isomerase FkpA